MYAILGIWVPAIHAGTTESTRIDDTLKILSNQKNGSGKTLNDADFGVIPAGIAGIHDCMDAGGRATQEQLPS